MNFLAPLFFLGALAIVGPILLHLIRKTTRNVTPFSTLMFLQETPPRITKRSRLENLALLILRCLALLLLAAAFARPFFRESSRTLLAPQAAGRRLVLVIDTSASMRRGDLWTQAKAKAEKLVEATTPDDWVALVAFDGSARDTLSFEDWRKAPASERKVLAQQRLGALQPGYGESRIDTALLHAAELLEQPGTTDVPVQREIVLISDLQEGARLERLQGFTWPTGVAVRLRPIAAASGGNAGIAWLPDTSEDTAPQTAAPGIRVRVTTTADSTREQYEVRWAGPAAVNSAPTPVYVPAGKARIVRMPMPPPGADRLVLSGDGFDFDNTAFVLPPHPEHVPVLYLGTEPETDPAGLLYYVRRAFPPTTQQVVDLTPHRTNDPLPGFQLQQARLAIIGSGAGEVAVQSLREFVASGHTAIVPLVNADSAKLLGTLLKVEPPAVTEANVRDYAMLSRIDFQHPLLAPFADPRFSDFSKIHFWHHRTLDLTSLPGAKAVAEFDDGSPALVQVEVERGSVLVFTSTWRPADSQLALSSKFLPLLQSILDHSGTRPITRTQYTVGDEIPLPEGPAKLSIAKPDGKVVEAAPGTKFCQADQPGIYRIQPGTDSFVVNLAPEEWRTLPLSAERFSSLGVPIAQETLSPAEAARRDARTQAAELENRQKLWRWGILACVVCVLAETVVASGLVRRPATASPTA